MAALPLAWGITALPSSQTKNEQLPGKNIIGNFLILWLLAILISFLSSLATKKYFIFQSYEKLDLLRALLVSFSGSFFVLVPGFIYWIVQSKRGKIPGSKRPFLNLVKGYTLPGFVSLTALYFFQPYIFGMRIRGYPFSFEFFLLGFVLLSFPIIWSLFFIEKKFLRDTRKDIKRRYLIILSALFTALAFPQLDLPLFRGQAIFAWFSLVPLFFYMQDGKNWKEVLLRTYLYGAFLNVFLLYWTQNFGEPSVFFLAFSMPLFYVLPLTAAEIFSRRLNPLFYPLFISSAFLLGDGLRTIGYLAFPWGFLGYSQAEWPSIMMFSRFGGVWLVSLLPLLNNIFWARLSYYLFSRESAFPAGDKDLSLLRKFFSYFKVAFVMIFKPRGRAGKDALIRNTGLIYIGFILVFLTFAFINKTGIPEIDSELKGATQPKKFIIVQPVFDPWVSWTRNKHKYFQILKKYTAAGMEPDTDFILWTESSTLEKFALYEKRGLKNLFQENTKDLIKNYQRPLLTGAIDNDFKISKNKMIQKHYNALTLFNGNGEIVKNYRKIKLVPFGEWFPYDKLIPGIRSVLDSFGASQWTPGKKPVVMKIKEMGSFAPLICYEGIFFRLVREYVNLGADYFINLTNLMWTTTYAGHMQHAIFSQMRAMEQNRYFIRAANDGLSCVIDPYGRIIKSIPLYKPGVLRAKVDIAKRPVTFYGRNGDWLLYTMIGIFVLLTLVSIVKRRGYPEN